MEFDVIGYVFSNGVLTLTVNGSVFTVEESDPTYPEVWAVMDDKSLTPAEKATSITDVLNPKPKKVALVISDYTTEDIEIDRYGAVFIAGQKVDDPVTRKIAELHQAGLPFDPLVKFMNKVSRNPDKGVRAQLFQFLQVSKFPLSEDGDFLGYKGVRDDLWDQHTGKTFQYTPGAVLSMPRDEVCDDPNQGCEAGIHVGSFDYAKSFTRSELVILVKVDPANVVSVPTDYSYQKLRACELTVARVVPLQAELNRPIYTDDDFDIDDEEEWEAAEEESSNATKAWAASVSVDRMSRDALCTHAATTSFFNSAAEARYMGKDFVRAVLTHDTFMFPKVVKRDLQKLLRRRGKGFGPRDSKQVLADRCDLGDEG